MLEAGDDNKACCQLLKLQMDRILVQVYWHGKLKDNAQVLEIQYQVVDEMPTHGKEPATCRTVHDDERPIGKKKRTVLKCPLS
jgi:hypothetical protein